MALQQIIQQHILRSNDIAERASVQLGRFPPDDLEAILRCLDPQRRTPNSNSCGPLWNRDENSGFDILARLFGTLAPSGSVYVKPNVEDFRKSAETGLALCVNKSGKLELLSSNYAIVSHVWGETMGWSTFISGGPVELSVKKKGLPLSHLQRFFEHCKISVEWLWLDAIALPEVLEDMTALQKAETEELRNKCINRLRDVYTRADFVIVLDSTLLRLRTESQIDVAVVLSLSRWIRRIWCFTEGWLAKAVKLQTATRSFDLDDIIDTLDLYALSNQSHRYFDLYVHMSKLRSETADRVRIARHFGKQTNFSPLFVRIFFAIEKCHTYVSVDYARALFPILNLHWESKWALQDGIRHLYESYPGAKIWIEEYLKDNHLL